MFGIVNRPHPRKPERLAEVFECYRVPVYFVTFCTSRRQRLLACNAVHDALRQYAERGYAQHGITVGRYVIMPDHVHFFVCGDAAFDLGLWIRGLKRLMAAAIESKPSETTAATPLSLSRSLWQPGFFDHLLRNSESYAVKWEYVRQNPVRAGLVTHVEDWPYQGEVFVIDCV